MFCVDGSISGLLFWGKPDDSDTEALDAVLAAAQQRTRPQSWLVDLSRLEVLDLRVFERLSSRVIALLSASKGGVSRQAIVSPRAMPAVMTMDAFAKVAGGAPVCSFADTREALHWIGVADGGLLAQLATLPTSHDDMRWLTTEFRSCLERGHVESVKGVARQMAMSPRTMQRRLLKLGTSFQQEVAEARLRRAKELMRTTNRSLKSIAFEVGYTSPQHFSATFHQQVGLSPSRWRSEF